MCGATQRGRGSTTAPAIPDLPSGGAAAVGDGSPGGGGGGGGTFGLTTDLRWLDPESRKDTIGLQRTGEKPGGEIGLGKCPEGLSVEEILGDDMSSACAAPSRPEKNSSDPGP